jgi:hypothetical protein
VIHYKVNRDTFQVEGLDFASRKIRYLMFDCLQNFEVADVVRFFRVSANEPKQLVFRHLVYERLVFDHVSKARDESWTARSLHTAATRAEGIASELVIPLLNAKTRPFDSLSELTPGISSDPVFWLPKCHLPSTDFILTVGAVVYFLHCTLSTSYEIVVEDATGIKLGLLQQATALAKQGFDTADGCILNYVHITESRLASGMTARPLVGPHHYPPNTWVEQWVVELTVK